MRKLKIIPILALSCLLLWWMGALVKCNILTDRYGQEFTMLHEQTGMIGDVDFIKVIDYSHEYAEVYYVSENASGNVCIFAKQDNEWVLASWNTIWSSSGSASGFIWPYFYHSAEGFLTVIIIGIPLLMAALLLLFRKKRNRLKRRPFRYPCAIL